MVDFVASHCVQLARRAGHGRESAFVPQIPHPPPYISAGRPLERVPPAREAFLTQAGLGVGELRDNPLLPTVSTVPIGPVTGGSRRFIRQIPHVARYISAGGPVERLSPSRADFFAPGCAKGGVTAG